MSVVFPLSVLFSVDTDLLVGYSPFMESYQVSVLLIIS
jgi:hypothetical protein